MDLRTCMECGKAADLVGGERIYPHRPDLFEKRFYLCVCGAYVGCHDGTEEPLGYPAGPETRAARSAAHRAFDPLWKGGRALMSRREAYRWLGEQMGTPTHRTHISWMNAEQARHVAMLCRPIVPPDEQETRDFFSGLADV